MQIYWHWEAMLISFLQVRKTVLPFSSLEDLYENTDFNVSFDHHLIINVEMLSHMVDSAWHKKKFKYNKTPTGLLNLQA